MKKKYLSGVICSIRPNHLTVSVARFFIHPLYRKRVKVHKKYIVKCDEVCNYKIGDKLNFVFCRPLSKKVFCIVL